MSKELVTTTDYTVKLRSVNGRFEESWIVTAPDPDTAIEVALHETKYPHPSRLMHNVGLGETVEWDIKSGWKDREVWEDVSLIKSSAVLTACLWIVFFIYFGIIYK